MTTRVVTVAHTTGAGGESLGRSVAERLGFRLVDEQILELAALKSGLDPAVVADAERRQTLLTRLLEGLGNMPVIDLSGMGAAAFQDLDVPRRDQLRGAIVEAIHDTAQSGDVVIVSHAAGIPLAGRAEALRVLVTASFETRATRLAAERHLARESAERQLKESDAGREDYFRRFHGIECELPTHYDLVINTDRLRPEDAVEVVVAAARRQSP